jgi:hypothetical protein
LKCQSAPNGNFCFGPSGGSFTLGHPGGAYNGESWNPFGGTVGTPGGLLVGSIGSADDVATVVDDIVEKLRARNLSLETLKGILNDMQELVARVEHVAGPTETQASNAAKQIA